MRTMNGGYAMINLASATIHADALAALASNKPIVVYEATGAPYYADSVTTSGTSVIITKGGKTITIANDNTITSEGDIQNHLYQYAFSDDDDKYTIKVLSKVNCTIENTDDDLSNDDIKSLVDLIKDLQSQSNNYNVGSFYDDTDDTSATLNITNLTSNKAQLFLQGSDDIVGITIDIDDNVYTLTNDDGYFYIVKTQLF